MVRIQWIITAFFPPAVCITDTRIFPNGDGIYLGNIFMFPALVYLETIAGHTFKSTFVTCQWVWYCINWKSWCCGHHWCTDRRRKSMLSWKGMKSQLVIWCLKASLDLWLLCIYGFCGNAPTLYSFKIEKKKNLLQRYEFAICKVKLKWFLFSIFVYQFKGQSWQLHPAQAEVRQEVSFKQFRLCIVIWLNGVAPLMMDPSPTSSTTFSEKKQQQIYI